jgi:hypothetical protein
VGCQVAGCGGTGGLVWDAAGAAKGIGGRLWDGDQQREAEGTRPTSAFGASRPDGGFWKPRKRGLDPGRTRGQVAGCGRGEVAEHARNGDPA